MLDMALSAGGGVAGGVGGRCCLPVVVFNAAISSGSGCSACSASHAFNSMISRLRPLTGLSFVWTSSCESARSSSISLLSLFKRTFSSSLLLFISFCLRVRLSKASYRLSGLVNAVLGAPKLSCKASTVPVRCRCCSCCELVIGSLIFYVVSVFWVFSGSLHGDQPLTRVMRVSARPISISGQARFGRFSSSEAVLVVALLQAQSPREVHRFVKSRRFCVASSGSLHLGCSPVCPVEELV